MNHRMGLALAPSSLALVSLVFVLSCDNDPTKGRPAAAVGAAVTVASAPGSDTAATNLTISSDSSKVVFVGSKVTGKEEGAFHKFSGTIQLTGTTPETAKVHLEIDMASLKTGQDRLDSHLKSADFFDIEHFPKATFQSTSIVAGGPGGATHTVTGNLELHGVTKSISFPATIVVSANDATASAEFTINRKDFGIVYPGKPDDLIRDQVIIRLSIKGVRS